MHQREMRCAVNRRLQRNPPVLLRILLPTNSRLYPMVSGSKHRVTIQFQHWNGVSERDEIQRRDIKFQLARCRL